MQRNITKSHVLSVVVFLIILVFVYSYFRENFTSIKFCDKVCVVPEKDLFELENKLDEIDEKNEGGQCPKGSWRTDDMIMESGLKYPQPSTMIGRSDVNTVTNWNAPLVWEGTFDPVVIDAIYKRKNPRIAVVVFAVGKYTRFLQKFIETGEKYFLVGFNVTYYIHTDRKDEVPAVPMAKGRKVTVVSVPSAQRWQDVVLGRMKWATSTIETTVQSKT